MLYRPEIVVSVVCAVAWCSLSPLQAQSPALLPCQGWVKSGGAVFSGAGQFKFALVSALNSVVWSNSPVVGAQPSAAVPLQVNGGFFHVLLGDTALSNMAALPPPVFRTSGLKLRIWFNDGARGFQQLTPDQRLAAMASAFHVAEAGTVPDGSITTDHFAAGSVTATKIEGPVTSFRLADSIMLGSSAGTADHGRLDIHHTGSGPALTLDGATRSLEIFGGIDGLLGSRQRRVHLNGADSGVLELCDESGGDVSARLQAFATGGSMLLHNGAGTLRASLTGTDSGGLATLYQADGQAGVTVDGDFSGSGAVFVADALGASRVRAKGGGSTGGTFEVLNGAGSVTALISHSGEHGALSLRHSGGGERIYATATNPSAVLGLRNAAGDTTAEFASSSAGPAAGTMTLRNASARTVAQLSNVVSTSLELSDSSGAERVFAHHITGGRLRLKSATGFPGIQLNGAYRTDSSQDIEHGGGIVFDDKAWNLANSLSSAEFMSTISWSGSMTVTGTMTTDSDAYLASNTWANEDVDVSGIVECADVVYNSDARLKDAGPRWHTGMAALRGVHPVTWTWKPDNPRGHQHGRSRAGVLARALRKVLPEAVVEGEDGFLSIHAAPVVWSLVNACRELAEEREILNNKAAGLAQDRSALLKRMEALERRMAKLTK